MTALQSKYNKYLNLQKGVTKAGQHTFTFVVHAHTFIGQLTATQHVLKTKVRSYANLSVKLGIVPHLYTLTEA